MRALVFSPMILLTSVTLASCRVGNGDSNGLPDGGADAVGSGAGSLVLRAGMLGGAGAADDVGTAAR